MAKLLNFDEILKAPDVEYVIVAAPKWGGDVRLGSISAWEMAAWAENRGEGSEAQRESNLNLVTRCLVDAEGNRIGDLDQVRALGDKDAETVRRLVQEAHRLNGMGTTKVVADAAKNE